MAKHMLNRALMLTISCFPVFTLRVGAEAPSRLPSFEKTPPEKRIEGTVYRDEAGEPIYWPKGLVTAEEVYGNKLHIKPQPKRGYTAKDFHTEGFAFERLTPLPEPGVHPRLFITPDDIARIRKNVELGEKAPLCFQRYWRTFLRDAGVDKDGKYQPAGFAGVGYSMTNRFICQAIYAQVMKDDALGKALADSIAQATQEDAKALDLFDQQSFRDNWWVVSDTRWLPDGHPFKRKGQWYWTGYPESYDLTWRWMTDEQRAGVRKIMARIFSKDRYSHFMELPTSRHLINHASMAMLWLTFGMAIEGEDGYSEETYRKTREVFEEVLDWYISPDGIMYENVKGFLPWQLYLAIARRENGKILQHPHILNHVRRSLFTVNNVNHNHIQWTRPPCRNRETAKTFFDPRNPDSRGWQVKCSGHPHVLLAMMNWFYPERPDIDMVYKAWRYQQNHAFMLKPEISTWTRQLEFPAIMLAFADDGMRDEDGKPIDWRKTPFTLEKKLSFVDMERGIADMRSSWDKDAFAMHIECRSDFYTGGHESPEFGNFTFSANGVYWAPYQGPYQPALHRNVVTIDGLNGKYPPVPGRFESLEDKGIAATAVMDYAEAMQFAQWSRNEMINHPKLDIPFHHWMRGWYGWGVKRNWQLNYFPHLRWFNEYYASTDFGHWDGQNTGGSFLERILPPVKYAWRTAQLTRGDYPYLLMLDDIETDGKKHAFRWNLSFYSDITLFRQPKANQMLLCRLDVPWSRSHGSPAHHTPSRYSPKKGEPMLYVEVLNRNTDDEHPHAGFEIVDNWPMVVVPANTTSPAYKVLIYPYKHGEPAPSTEWNEDKTRLTIAIGDQKDTYVFAKAAEGRTVYTMARNGQSVGPVQGRPAKPVVEGMPPQHQPSRYAKDGQQLGPPPQPKDPEPIGMLVFTDEATLKFGSVGSGQEIRYTTDGSVPAKDSTLYTGPVTIKESTTVKAITHSRYWPFGKNPDSQVAEARFVKQAPISPSSLLAPRSSLLSPGLLCRVYEIYRMHWNTTGHIDPSLSMLPPLDKYEPILTTATPGFALPPVQPQKPIEEVYKGFYRFTGMVTIAEAGAYTFKVHSNGPVVVSIAGQRIINETGLYHLDLIDRFGQIALGEGQHAVELVVCDPIFWKKGREGDMDFSVAWSRDGGAFTPIADAMCTAPAAELKKYAANPYAPKAADLPSFRAVSPKGKLINDLTKSVYNQSERVKIADGWLYSQKAGPEGLFDIDRKAELERTFARGQIEGSDYDGQIYVYGGYYKAPYDGVYQFVLDGKGNNQLRIGKTVVVQNNVPGFKSDGRVKLAAGYHPIQLRFGRSGGLVRVKSPADSQPQKLSRGDLFCDAAAKPIADPRTFAVLDLPVKAYAKAEQTVRCPLGKYKLEIDGARLVDDETMGQVIEFSGEESGLHLTDWPALKRGLTFSFWLKADDPRRHGSLLAFSGEGAEAGFYGGGIRAKYSRYGGVHRRFDITKWNHVVLVFGYTVWIYVNGEEKGSYYAKGDPTFAGRPNNLNCRTAQLHLFCGRGGGRHHVKGRACDIRVYTGALSDEDVKKLYDDAAKPKTR